LRGRQKKLDKVGEKTKSSRAIFVIMQMKVTKPGKNLGRALMEGKTKAKRKMRKKQKKKREEKKPVEKKLCAAWGE